MYPATGNSELGCAMHPIARGANVAHADTFPTLRGTRRTNATESVHSQGNRVHMQLYSRVHPVSVNKRQR